MAEDFISRLRMANIFTNPSSNVNPGQAVGRPMGMPDMDPGPQFNVNSMIQNAAGMQENQRQLQQIRMLGERDINAPHRIQQIGSGIVRQPGMPGQQQPEQMNQVFKDSSITPFQKEQLAIEREKLQQKTGSGSQDIALKARKQELAEKIAGGKATDEEKHEYNIELAREKGNVSSRLNEEKAGYTSTHIGERSEAQLANTKLGGEIGSTHIRERGNEQRDNTALAGKIGAELAADKGEITTGHIDRRAGHASDLADQKGDLARDLLGIKGEQGLAAVAARIEGQKAVKQTIPGRAPTDRKSELPTQTRARMQNTINNIRLTRPDLAQYIMEDDLGNIVLNPDAGDSSAAIMEIRRLLSNMDDVKLPTEQGTKPSIAAPKTPTAGDPLGIR